jgi:hypothetical protein
MHLDRSNLKETVMDPTKNVVVLFTWDGCSPCAYVLNFLTLLDEKSISQSG